MCAPTQRKNSGEVRGRTREAQSRYLAIAHGEITTHHRCTARLRISYSLALTFIRYVQREYFIHSSKSNFASCFYYYASHDGTRKDRIVCTYVYYSVSVCYFYHFNHSNKFHTVYTTLLLFS